MEPLRDDLRLLSIFHYVLAGFTLLFSCVPLAYIGMGVAIALRAFGEAGRDGPPPLFLGWIMGGLGVFLLVLVLGYGVAMILAGRSIARRRNWLFCMIMAGLSCPSFPFGTALGVFTLVILSKPEVKALFTAPRPSAQR